MCPELGILGALQWPAVQGIPSLAATSSILAAEINTGSGQLLTDLNKALRFGKSAAEVKLQMTKVTDSIDNLCFLAFSDAAFGVRADGSSQGGYFILMTDKAALEGELVKYNVLSWRSSKLTRVCRSSLAAEAQSLAAAMDEMMLIRTIISLMLFPGRILENQLQLNLARQLRLWTPELFTMLSRRTASTPSRTNGLPSKSCAFRMS